MDQRRLLIYADTHPGVGIGHLMRSLALAEAWVDQAGPCALVTERWPDGFEMIPGVDLATVGSVDVANHLAQLVGHQQPAWLVIDGYRTTPAAMAAIPRAATRLAVLRDHGMPAPPADLILDPNAGALASAYIDDAPDAVVLAGVDYALLRRSFRAVRSQPPVPDRPGLIMAGGSPSPAVVDLIEAVVARLAPGKVDLLGGGLGDVRLPSTVRRLGVVSDPAVTMAGRPWAMTPSGSTVWELCCLGVPSVLFAAAPNQEGVGLAMAEAGAGTYLGEIETLVADDVAEAVTTLAADAARRDEMAQVAASLVDGLGAGRAVAELRAAAIELTDVTADHAELLFAWRNDPDVRAASFSVEPISWSDHQTWLARQLDDPDTLMFVASVESEPIGQIRFDTIGPGQLRVGVSLAGEARGRRLAAPLIVAGTRAALERSGTASVLAEVKAENERSASAFTAAGYSPVGEVDGVVTYLRLS